jgi:hypothetical protein
MKIEQLDKIMLDLFDIKPSTLHSALFTLKCSNAFHVDIRKYYVFALNQVLGYKKSKIIECTNIKMHQCYYYINKVLNDDSSSNKYYVKELYKRIRHEQSKIEIGTY